MAYFSVNLDQLQNASEEYDANSKELAELTKQVLSCVGKVSGSTRMKLSINAKIMFASARIGASAANFREIHNALDKIIDLYRRIETKIVDAAKTTSSKKTSDENPPIYVVLNPDGNNTNNDSGSSSDTGSSENTGNFHISEDGTITLNGVSLDEVNEGGKFITTNSDGTLSYHDTSAPTHYYMVNGERVDLKGAQCMGFARYVQEKMYGCNDFTDRSRFSNVAGSEDIPGSAMTGDLVKSLVTEAGVGGHIRTLAARKWGHSMIIAEVTDTGFTVIDANGDGNDSVDARFYTWDEYANSNFGQRGLDYIRKFDG